eukprot:TRINITY_DN4611_c0_g3_i12.p2 TRINITY_DN4611_c0_g3~~TRINITY_DN4611_c0_g3_i12.p2  ORF type:complete len:336 (-),score=77.53 TRINITY_DN4611_c0_g3_i12:464-1471(-)
MLVDLGRNDVNRTVTPETSKVDSMMHVEYFSHVMHIVSWVSGRLRSESSPLMAFRALFPAGTVSGAPKIKAMELVASLEKEKRGVYAGAIGYFSFTGDLDTCIAIRTIVVKDGVAYLQAGGGIVYDSKEDDEWIETLNKMAAPQKTIDNLEQRKVERNITMASTTGAVVSSPYEVTENFHRAFRSSPENLAPLIAVEPGRGDYTPKNPRGTTTLLIDNYDSFTWNLFQYFTQLGERVIVHRNDKITVEECLSLKPDYLVVSPGPGNPSSAGISKEVIRAFLGQVPILGVCLGHQCLVELLGGSIVYAGEIKHGKTSLITHDGKGIYEGIHQPFNV